MVCQNEKIRPHFLGAYELSICLRNISHPFPYHAVYYHQEIRLWPPSVLILCITITSKGTDQQDIFELFHMSPLIKHTNVHIQMSSSICMTARDDNDELEGAFVKQPYVLHSIKFQNVCLCMIMYMWELFARVEFSVELYILHEETNIRVSAISVPTVLCILDF